MNEQYRCRGIIVAVIGMQHGSAVEMQRQLIYNAQRVREYAQPGLPPGAACVVIDVAPAERGAPACTSPPRMKRGLELDV